MRDLNALPNLGTAVNNPTLHGLHLLVVEDDPLLGPLLADFLKGEGATIAGPWPTTRAAAEALRQQTPTAALLDVNLLDGDSYGIAMALEAEGVPYAFVSASDPDHVPKGLRPLEFMQKPASFNDVLALAQRLSRAR